ncbi:MAG: hypothetical protein KDI37_12195 [Xanthomonadales bacterium]|nr:hypothetical protein [Xanthomonadales bacterium]
MSSLAIRNIRTASTDRDQETLAYLNRLIGEGQHPRIVNVLLDGRGLPQNIALRIAQRAFPDRNYGGQLPKALVKWIRDPLVHAEATLYANTLRLYLTPSSREIPVRGHLDAWDVLRSMRSTPLLTIDEAYCLVAELMLEPEAQLSGEPPNKIIFKTCDLCTATFIRLERGMKRRNAWLQGDCPVCRSMKCVQREVGPPLNLSQNAKRLIRAELKFHELVALEGEELEGKDRIWYTGREFQGRKSYQPTEDRREYDYEHGSICNRLQDALQACSPPYLRFGRNKNVDAALVDRKQKAAFLFEVKTAALPSSQIYSAVGQLFYYRHLYGTSSSRLYVVLPGTCRSSQTESFLAKLDIGVLYEQSEGFVDPSGRGLAEILRG